MKLAMDIGGTKVLIALIDNNKIKKSYFFLTKKDFLDKIINITKEIIKKYKIDKICIATAGPGDYKKGIIYGLNLPLRYFNIKKELKKVTKVKTIVENDANAFTYYHAKKSKYSYVLGITLGTGIGFGLVIKNEIYRGRGNACEFSHIILNSCELEKEYQKAKRHNSLNKIKRILSLVIFNSVIAYDPELIVIGGGYINEFTKIKSDVLNNANRLLSKFGLKICKVKIDPSKYSVIKGVALL